MPTGVFYAIYWVHKTTFQWSRSLNIDSHNISHSIVKYKNGLPIMYTTVFAVSAIAEDISGNAGEFFTMQHNTDRSVLCNGIIVKAYILIFCS